MKKFRILPETIRKEEEPCRECGKPIVWEGEIPFAGFPDGAEPWCTCDGNTMDVERERKKQREVHSSWEHPKYVVTNRKNGKQYAIVGATSTHYCLESVEKDLSFKKDRKAVPKDDPHDIYEVIGFYD